MEKHPTARHKPNTAYTKGSNPKSFHQSWENKSEDNDKNWARLRNLLLLNIDRSVWQEGTLILNYRE